MTYKHWYTKLYTPATGPSKSDKNEATTSNIESNHDAYDSLAMLDPKPGGIGLSDAIWMVDITGVDQDINII